MQKIGSKKTSDGPRALILQAIRSQAHAAKTVLSALVVGMFMTSHFAAAATVEGVTFADKVFIGPNKETRLPEGLPGTSALEDVPRRLDLSYFWAIGASDFADTAENFLKQTMSTAAFDKLQARVENLHTAYRDVRPSDRYTLTYQPKIGTTLRLNDESLVTIPGADFAKAYFGIWLGTPSLDDSLRDSLLNEP
jgi:hypothetical protein